MGDLIKVQYLTIALLQLFTHDSFISDGARSCIPNVQVGEARERGETTRNLARDESVTKTSVQNTQCVAIYIKAKKQGGRRKKGSAVLRLSASTYKYRRLASDPRELGKGPFNCVPCMLLQVVHQFSVQDKRTVSSRHTDIHSGPHCWSYRSSVRNVKVEASFVQLKPGFPAVEGGNDGVARQPHHHHPKRQQQQQQQTPTTLHRRNKQDHRTWSW